MSSLKSPEHFPVLFGIGNPLLDLSLKTDDTLLKKYNLNANEVYLSNPQNLPLFDEILKKSDLQMIPGGSSQNAIRAFQWMSGLPKASGYTGCVGDDKLGKQQKELMLKANVSVQYNVAKGEKTGKCAALITGENRCLVADIAGASKFDPLFLYDATLRAQMDKAKIIYAEGFFVDVSMEALMIIAHRCYDQGKYFALNFSATWVIEKCSKKLEELLPFVSYLFCNEDEAREFAKQVKWYTEDLDGDKKNWNIKEIAKMLSLYPKVDAAKTRVVVITQGKEDVILSAMHTERSKYVLSLPQAAKSASKVMATTTMFSPSNAMELRMFKVPVIPDEEFKDSNGCGDSFVGGFFEALFLEGKTLDEAVNAGIWMAQVCARHEGVVFNATPPDLTDADTYAAVFGEPPAAEGSPRLSPSSSTSSLSLSRSGSFSPATFRRLQPSTPRSPGTPRGSPVVARFDTPTHSPLGGADDSSPQKKAEKAEKKGGMGAIIGAVVGVLVLAAGGAAAFFVLGKQGLLGAGAAAAAGAADAA